MNDEARRKILARRARFVAAAVVSMGVAACEKKPEPVTTSPQPCLSVMAVPSDAGPVPEATDSSTATDASDAPDATDADASESSADAKPDTPKPMPCLKIAPPHPCLKIAPPENFE